MSNYDIYVKAGDVQVTGTNGILDSAGANYPGYNFTAPVIASYYNSLGREYFDCNTYGNVHLVANGHELDCGFLQVSYWETDDNGNEAERFTTLVAENKVRTIKKGRKIYVPVGEVERYFGSV